MDIGNIDCREKIISEQYYDVITDYFLGGLEESGYDLCATEVGGEFNVVYINRRDVVNAGEYLFQYRSVPKLYGLMQVGELQTALVMVKQLLQFYPEDQELLQWEKELGSSL